jgi:hypothetical protein
MLLHFGLTLPDRVISYQQKVLIESHRPTALLLHSLLPQPFAVPKRQWESLQVPCTELSP